MEAIFFLWSIPFFAVSAFHLAACIAEKNRAADVSKKLLMPFLILAVIGFSIFTGIDYNMHGAATIDYSRLEASAIAIIGGADGSTSIYIASKFSSHIITLFLCIALFFGTLGDIFLLGKIENSNFLKGMGSFLIEHLFYISILLLSFRLIFQFMPIPLWFEIIAVSIYVFAVIGTWIMNKKPKGVIGVTVIVYAFVLASVNCITLLLCASYVFSMQGGQCIFSVIPPSLIRIFCGSALFLISDVILSRTIFIGSFRMHRFFVMVTYIVAQFFIAWGICTI